MPATDSNHFLKAPDIIISLVISMIIGAACLGISAYSKYQADKSDYETNAQIALDWAQKGGKENCDAIRNEYTASLNSPSQVATCRRCCSDDMASCIDHLVESAFYKRKDILKRYVAFGCASIYVLDIESPSVKEPLPYYPPRVPDPVSIHFFEHLPIGAKSFFVVLLPLLSIFLTIREKHTGWRRAVIVSSPILAGAGLLASYESLSANDAPIAIVWVWSSILLGGVILIFRQLIGWIQQGFIDHIPEKQAVVSQVSLPVKQAAVTVTSNELGPEHQQLVSPLSAPINTLHDIDNPQSSDRRPDFAYRIVARIYDYAICFIVASIPTLLLRFAPPEEPSITRALMPGIVGTIAAALTFYFMERWCVFKFGGSPGKLLAGLRVKTKDGTDLTIKASGDRSLAVLSRGTFFMLGAPKLTILVNLVHWISGKRAWEKDSEVIFISEGVSQLRMVSLGVLSVALLTLMLVLGAVDKASNKQLIEESVIGEGTR